MKNNKSTLTKLSCLLIMTLLINLIYWSSIVKAKEKEKLYVNFSMKNPQEPGEVIEIISSTSGIADNGRYSYYIKEIGGEYTSLKEDISEQSIMWIPEKSGKYIIKVVYNKNGKLYETEKSYEITEDKKGKIDYFGFSDGDSITFRDNLVPIKATIPKENGEDRYIVRCRINERVQIMWNYGNYLVGPGEVRTYIRLGYEFYFLDKLDQRIRLELINTTKNRVEDVKNFDVRLLFPGIRHTLDIKEKDENISGNPIEISLNSSIEDLEKVTYSFYYRDMSNYKKYAIVEGSKNKTTQFTPNKPGIYEISGEINCFGIRKSYYSTVVVKDSETALDIENIFKEIKIKYSYDKNNIYVDKGIQITSEAIRDNEVLKGKVYVKSPISDDYELVNSIASEDFEGDFSDWFYSTDKYIPRIAGEHKVRTEISYYGETVIEEDSFYVKDIPEDNSTLLLESAEVKPIRYSIAGSEASEYFLIETLFGENDLNRGSNIGLAITMKKDNEVITSDYYVIDNSKSREVLIRAITGPGYYSIDLEFKNITIENSETIKKTFDFTVNQRPIENLRLELDKKVVSRLDEVEIAAFSDGNNEENCEYSFYSRKKGTEIYTPIIEKTESSVARFKPSESGEYEFKVIAHENTKDYVYEGGNLIVKDYKEDVNNDGKVTILDLSIVAEKYNMKITEEGFSKECDINGDGTIDIFDLVSVAKGIK